MLPTEVVNGILFNAKGTSFRLLRKQLTELVVIFLFMKLDMMPKLNIGNFLQLFLEIIHPKNL